MKYRFSSRDMKRAAARAAASNRSSRLERRLGMGILAVAPRDPLAELDEAIRKAGYAPRRRPPLQRRRRDLTDAERLERYEHTLARVYRHRWSLRRG